MIFRADFVLPLLFPALLLSAAGVVAVDRALDGASSPRERATRLAVDNTANVALVPPEFTKPTSGRCVVADATNVFVVDEAATGTASGDGPYCTTCTAGPLIPIAGRAWARTSAGAVTLSCRFVDDGGGFGGGGGPGLLAATVCLLAGGADCQLPSVRGSTFIFQDTGGGTDVQVSTSTSASGGGIVQIVDARTTLAATACDAASEVGQIVLYNDATSFSICVCENILGVIGWAAVTPGGDCI